MRLKTFTASTMKEAIAIVREEMGANAIIVSAYERPRGRGVEVRAAVDGVKPEPRAEPVRPKRPDPAPPPSEPQSAIEQIAARRVASPAVKRTARPYEAVLQSALAYHGLEQSIRDSILDAARKHDNRDPVDALSAVFDARLAFAPIPNKPRRPVMLVGAPGVGKTVTAAKLAARAKLAGEAVAVSTTDTLRSGAIEQLAKLLGLMGTKLGTADAPETLEGLLARGAKAEAAMFIDTPGTNVFAMGERRDLRRFMAAGDIEPVLVLAAGGDAAEMADQAKLFAEIGVRRFIVTRLDAARRLGGMLTAAQEGRLALAHVSLSPYLSEPLSTLSAASFARILIAQAQGAQTSSSAGGSTQSSKEQKAS